MTNFIDPNGKLLQHIDRLAEIKVGLHPAPVNVEIDLSNRCNLACKGCHMAHTHDGKLMDTQMALDILAQLAETGVRSVTWSGGGEPTMHPDIIKIIEACTLDQGIYTNGTNLTFELMPVLAERMKWVYISLDRNSRDSFMQYKGADKFQRVIAGASMLARSKRNAVVGVGFMIDAENWREIPNMSALALHKIGADYVQFRPLVTPGADRSWIKDALTVLEARISSAEIVDVDRFKRYMDWDSHGYDLCYWAQVQTVITPDGKVYACCNRRGMEDSCLGDLTSEKWTDIWARSHAWAVDGSCRLMCRGHIPNLTLDRMFKPQPHGNFI